MSSKNNFQLSVGGPSILMIFVVLCLTTFGVLSYISANADAKLSAKNAQAVQSYYAATKQAQEQLSRIDGALLQAESEAGQAVNSESLNGIKRAYSTQVQSEIGRIFQSNLSKTEKYERCYRVLSRALITERTGNAVRVDTAKNGAAEGSFSLQAGDGKELLVLFQISPYGSAGRYGAVSERLTRSSETGSSSGTLNVWQGNSSSENR